MHNYFSVKKFISFCTVIVYRRKRIMDFIIEIQGFQSTSGSFIPKEVVIVSIDKNYTTHWIVTPICNFMELPVNIRRHNNSLTLYKHGIEWFEGDVPEKYLFANLRKLSKHYCNKLWLEKL